MHHTCDMQWRQRARAPSLADGPAGCPGADASGDAYLMTSCGEPGRYSKCVSSSAPAPPPASCRSAASAPLCLRVLSSCAACAMGVVAAVYGVRGAACPNFQIQVRADLKFVSAGVGGEERYQGHECAPSSSRRSWRWVRTDWGSSRRRALACSGWCHAGLPWLLRAGATVRVKLRFVHTNGAQVVVIM